MLALANPMVIIAPMRVFSSGIATGLVLLSCFALKNQAEEVRRAVPVNEVALFKEIKRAGPVNEVLTNSANFGSEVIERAPVSQPFVALTLDAGSEAGPVPQMLQTLRERQIKITFFVTGDFIANYPDIVRQIAADGHEFGNHSLTHPDLRKVSDMQIRHELEATEQLLKLTTGKTTRPFFRPPYGEYDDRVLRLAQNEGFMTVCWSLDSLDSVGVSKSPRFLVDRITTRLGVNEVRGAIVLMHCDSNATATAMPVILDHFKSLKLDVVPLSRLLSAK
ncbi:MAG: polysaccharide deacetylase family protein [Verrucomicrobiaceae bacterium]